MNDKTDMPEPHQLTKQQQSDLDAAARMLMGMDPLPEGTDEGDPETT